MAELTFPKDDVLKLGKVIQLGKTFSTSDLSTPFSELNKLHKKYDCIIGAIVHFELEQNADVRGKICKMELSLPGPRLFASSNEERYEDAVKYAIKDLTKQLKKRKGLFKTH